ncbi:MAG: hypothetical protein KDB79_01550 [Acidobacteria bacterium]|nr:hypothetical protein [Acidobacteriota bacterium]
MLIAKIVGSNSHVDYIARVIDKFDTSDPPESDDYGFASFVSIPGGADTKTIGVIYNSMLMNPDYANYGPRLSPNPELGNFSPDFINEQGCLVGILLLGSIGDSGNIQQGVPARVIPPGQEVLTCDEEELLHFHTDKSGAMQIHYYSQIISHAGSFAVPLLESIIERLSIGCSDQDVKRLAVLKQNLAWQRTIGGMRL